jgi:hypothetical protein
MALSIKLLLNGIKSESTILLLYEINLNNCSRLSIESVGLGYILLLKGDVGSKTI